MITSYCLLIYITKNQTCSTVLIFIALFFYRLYLISLMEENYKKVDHEVIHLKHWENYSSKTEQL